METTLDEVGMEMYQEDEELVWELQLLSTTVLRLSEEDLERLIYRLADELQVMQAHRGYVMTEVMEVPVELPDGTDAIELLPDTGDDIVAALGDLAGYEDDDLVVGEDYEPEQFGD